MAEAPDFRGVEITPAHRGARPSGFADGDTFLSYYVSYEKMAHPKGFEPLASAFGGRYYTFRIASIVGRREITAPSSGFS
ncbi:hypothetical protein, partial [Rhodoblastus sp.]|uniref:hypothetical protein n=1 Tax=Rhodoblastus sp. TaxID=1962975 RepID=UPI00262DEAB1